MSDDYLDQLQADVYGILTATPSLALARILLDDDGTLEGKLEHELATADGRGGKAGLAVIVLACEVEDVEVNLPGPPLLVRVDVQCIELVELNRHAGEGTLIRSGTAATRALKALNHHLLGAHSLYAGKKPIIPLKMRPGFTAHLVSVRTMLYTPATAKASRPEVELAAGMLTLTSATAGAAICYSVDGSYPAPSTALAYSAPFPLPDAGTLIRAAAYADAHNPSDLLEFTTTA